MTARRDLAMEERDLNEWRKNELSRGRRAVDRAVGHWPKGQAAERRLAFDRRRYAAVVHDCYPEHLSHERFVASCAGMTKFQIGYLQLVGDVLMSIPDEAEVAVVVAE